MHSRSHRPGHSAVAPSNMLDMGLYYNASIVGKPYMSALYVDVGQGQVARSAGVDPPETAALLHFSGVIYPFKCTESTR